VGIREESGALTALQREIEKAVEPLGHPPEKRKFHPHLTLGRVKRGVSQPDVARLGEIVAGSQLGDLAQVEARLLHLFRSDLRPTGAVYTSLAAFEFGRGG
jgi:2'-5' RNA ligase